MKLNFEESWSSSLKISISKKALDIHVPIYHGWNQFLVHIYHGMEPVSSAHLPWYATSF